MIWMMDMSNKYMENNIEDYKNGRFKGELLKDLNGDENE